MPVKHWSFAGLMLTYWCSARCASCYLCCGPRGGDEMDVETALRIWRELIEASPHGCRIHLTGGEAFGDWPRLIELCRRARQEGLGPLEKVETNAFWAVDEAIVRERLACLNEAGMRKLVISCDPYHQQFVPIDQCRLAARVAEDMLGPNRVLVRWRDWLDGGGDTAAFSDDQREAFLKHYLLFGRDRYNGRAADALAPMAPRKALEELDARPCAESLLRSRHVHVDGAGRVMPGTCAGIILGQAGQGTIAEIWRRLESDHARRPVVGVLARQGPLGLLESVAAGGYARRSGYASKCHLCWDVRRHLALSGQYPEELGPLWLYQHPV